MTVMKFHDTPFLAFHLGTAQADWHVLRVLESVTERLCGCQQA